MSETSDFEYVGGTAYAFKTQGKGNAVYLSFSSSGKLDLYLLRISVTWCMASTTRSVVVLTCQMPL
eukprot:2580148-Ditylum_brightwellii.AAC.1